MLKDLAYQRQMYLYTGYLSEMDFDLILKPFTKKTNKKLLLLC